MASKQGITMLKLTGCNKIPIYPANWITDVEYEEGNANVANEDEDNDEGTNPNKPLNYETPDRATDYLGQSLGTTSY
jgi:hypothetical protein